uniref:Uncharacterized protein n=1 Tax=Arundo donax TaxID=35708 RepID=A0A0A9AT38_ARUDO
MLGCQALSTFSCLIYPDLSFFFSIFC